MRYLSVCSGIEAASVAWHPLGFSPVGFAEIEPFACSVLAHRFPGVTNYGDLTKYSEWEFEHAARLVVGGTPCQSFSVAGLRKGMADPRGNLALVFLGLVDRVQPKWVVWENVPGVLSSAGGRDFGSFLGALAQLGYGFAYRVLDAQFFGVPQRRRRVFVVGHRGDWRRAAAVLFDTQSVRRDHSPSRKAGQEIAGTIASRTRSGGGLGTDFDIDGGLVAGTLGANHGNVKAEHAWTGQLVCGTLQASGKAAGSATQQDAEAGLLVPVAFHGSQDPCSSDEVFSSVGRNQGQETCVAYQCQGTSVGEAGTLRKGNGNVTGGVPFLPSGIGVRRLMPLECERLQGLPDNWTLVPHRGKPAADGPRYRAIGNSMAVPCMAWIGRRIQIVDLMDSKT